MSSVVLVHNNVHTIEKYYTCTLQPWHNGAPWMSAKEHAIGRVGFLSISLVTINFSKKGILNFGFCLLLSHVKCAEATLYDRVKVGWSRETLSSGLNLVWILFLKGPNWPKDPPKTFSIHSKFWWMQLFHVFSCKCVKMLHPEIGCWGRKEMPLDPQMEGVANPDLPHLNQRGVSLALLGK